MPAVPVHLSSCPSISTPTFFPNRYDDMKNPERKLERELKKTQAERDKDKDEVLAILDQSA